MRSEALTLRVSDSRENDRLITVLSKEQGILRVFANGAKKPKSPLHGMAQPFAYGQIECQQRRDTYTLTGAQAKGVFFTGLAADITRLALAEYFAALLLELSPQEEPAPAQLRLALNALHFLSTGLRPQPLLKAVVELRLLCLAGYQPDLEGSSSSGTVYLHCRSGTLRDSPGSSCVSLPPPVLEAMRFLCAAPLERAFRFALPQEGLRTLAYAAEHYMEQQTGRRFPELAYYAKLQ